MIILHVSVIPKTLKECFSLSKSLHEKGIFSWYSYINHVRTKIKMDLGNQDMKKNYCKKYYKNILNKDYEEIFDNKLKSIDNNSKLFLFKAFKSKNKSEFYLKYPDFEIRRLICKFRLSDHSLAIETGRYKKIPRHLRTCNKCETLDDENHFFLNCKLNEHLRKAFLSDFGNIDN
jgi:hypothetical protein